MHVYVIDGVINKVNPMHWTLATLRRTSYFRVLRVRVDHVRTGALIAFSRCLVGLRPDRTHHTAII